MSEEAESNTPTVDWSKFQMGPLRIMDDGEFQFHPPIMATVKCACGFEATNWDNDILKLLYLEHECPVEQVVEVAAPVPWALALGLRLISAFVILGLALILVAAIGQPLPWTR